MKKNYIITNTFDFKQLPILLGLYGAILGVALLIFGLENEKKLGPYAMQTLIGVPALIWVCSDGRIDRILGLNKRKK